MGLINKPFDHIADTLAEATKVNANDNTLYSEFNGNITDPNISATANIAQSKIATLVADLAARLLLAGGQMTGALEVKFEHPYFRLIGTEGSARDYKIVETLGVIIIQRNDGTELIPSWATVYQFKFDGTPTEATDVPRKDYVDALTRSLAFGSTVKTDGQFSTGSTGFVDVTGLAVTMTTGARRVRVSTVLSGISNSAIATLGFRTLVDAAPIAPSNILVGNADSNPATSASSSFITDVLSAGAHVFQVQMKVQAGTGVLGADSDTPAVLQCEELPLDA